MMLPQDDPTDSLPPEMMRQELQIRKRNLGILYQQAAIYGEGLAPLHVFNQIELETKQIRLLERQIKTTL